MIRLLNSFYFNIFYHKLIKSVTNNNFKIITNASNTGLQGNKRFREYENQISQQSKSTCRPATQLHSFTNWRNFPTQPPVCSRNDGFSAQLDGITFPKWRNESLKAYGNAIVPQVAYQLFKVINELIESEKE